MTLKIPGLGLGQAQKCSGVKTVNEILTCPYDNTSLGCSLIKTFIRYSQSQCI
jgi:hypothetical protein